MPIYEYQAVSHARSCDRCKARFEVVQSMRDRPLTACPACGAPIHRLISRCGICKQSEKSMLSDRNLKEKGFKKLVRDDSGSYRDVL
jgi:putative FmdB family regulatory protein